MTKILAVISFIVVLHCSLLLAVLAEKFIFCFLLAEKNPLLLRTLIPTVRDYCTYWACLLRITLFSGQIFHWSESSYFSRFEKQILLFIFQILKISLSQKLNMQFSWLPSFAVFLVKGIQIWQVKKLNTYLDSILKPFFVYLLVQECEG